MSDECEYWEQVRVCLDCGRQDIEKVKGGVAVREWEECGECGGRRQIQEVYPWGCMRVVGDL